jgi:hypothetical protein
MRIVEERLYQRKDRPKTGRESEVAVFVNVADDGRMWAPRIGRFPVCGHISCFVGPMNGRFSEPPSSLVTGAVAYGPDKLVGWEPPAGWELVASRMRKPGDHDPIC